MPLQSNDDVSGRRGSSPYERIEVCLCCVVWPTVGLASGALLDWLLLDNEQRTGWFSRAASSVFVVVLAVSLLCTLEVWSRLIMALARWLRDHQRLDAAP